MYRARDTRLKREVALKVLPDNVADDPERLARFQREAEVLASLSHPNIGAIYGLEEQTDVASGFPGPSGVEGSRTIRALVLELVEGDTLAERIARGAIPVDEALAIAKQIAEALEAAHEQRIIHRDLKPANIKVSAEGLVKVLDFGLAKLTGPADAGHHVPSVADGRGVRLQPDLTGSPTITSPAMMTGVGVILGTAAYMAPEQAKGRPADKRSDIWAFGCVLYEMLAGRRVFEGEDVSDTLAAVLRGEPDWNALPAQIPPAVGMLLRRCLEKDARQRITAAGALLLVLRDFASLVAAPVERAGTPVPLWRRAWPAVASAVVAGLVVVATAWFASQPIPPRSARFVLNAEPAAPVRISSSSIDVTLAPDGSRIAYIAGSGSQSLIHVRALDALESMPLPGTDGAVDPFFSPDGRWIAYWAQGELRKVSVLGGPPVRLTPMGIIRGGAWENDATIIVSTPGGFLFRVPAGGGDRVVLAPAGGSGGGNRRWPEILPGGRALLVTTQQGSQSGISMLDLETLVERPLVSAGTNARYSPTGHLLYGVEGTLRAVPFDLGRLEVTGDPVPVLEGVMTKGTGAVNFDVADDGSIAYVAGGSGVVDQDTIVSVDRQGRATELPGIPPDEYRDVKVSPDGSRVAVATADDVWIYEFGRAILSRLTTHAAPDRSPLWTRDGSRIVFTSVRDGYAELYSRSADGTGTDERLLVRSKELVDLRAQDWSADGRQLLFVDVPPNIRCTIGQIGVGQPSSATTLLQNDFCNDYPAVSPDGRWIAYDSTLSGREEVYVERYPGLGSRQQVSIEGGLMPRWSKSGGEIVFSSLDSRRMFAVPVKGGETLAIGRPQMLFEGAFRAVQTGFQPYDVLPDGRFVMIRTATDTGGRNETRMLILVQNWVEELKRLVPVN